MSCVIGYELETDEIKPIFGQGDSMIQASTLEQVDITGTCTKDIILTLVTTPT